MAYILDPELLKKELAPLSIEARGKYMSKAIHGMIIDKKSYPWARRENPKKKTAIPKDYSPEFLEFWAVYHPHRRKAKRKTFESWIRSPYTQTELLKLCKDALEWQRKTRAWQEENGTYFPLSTTYLNQARYEDENPDNEEMEEYINADGEVKIRRKTC